MKVLSVQQPWASLICAGIKDVENRTWKAAQVPGRILIHASSKKITGNFFNNIPEEMESYIANNIFFGNLAPLNELPTSAIIGYVTVKEFDDGEMDSVWADEPGVIKWKLEDAWMFDEPILNVKGKLNLFDYDLDENNLPPAHQVDLMSVEVNDAEDEVIVPCYELPFKEIGNNNTDGFDIYLTDDLIEVLSTQDDNMSMKPFKTITLVCGNKYKRFELDKDANIYAEPDLDDKEKPYIIQYHDGQEGCWFAAKFFLGKKIDEGELAEFCGGEFITDIEIVNNLKTAEDSKVLKFKVNKETFKAIITGEQTFFQKEITPKNLSTFFVLNEDGTVKEIKGIPQLRRYGAIQFINKDDSYTCQINNADVVYMNPEYGDKTPYSKLEEDKRVDYTDCVMSYALGNKI